MLTAALIYMGGSAVGENLNNDAVELKHAAASSGEQLLFRGADAGTVEETGDEPDMSGVEENVDTRARVMHEGQSRVNNNKHYHHNKDGSDAGYTNQEATLTPHKNNSLIAAGYAIEDKDTSQ